MTEATIETEKNGSRSKRASSRPNNGNAAPDTEKPKIEVLADKLYRALVCARAFASEKSKSPAHTVLRFLSDGNSEMLISAYDGKSLTELRVPIETCTKSTTFCMHARFVPTIVKLLAALHQEEREKTSATIRIGKREIEVSVDSTFIRVPHTEEQLEFSEFNKLIPEESAEGVYLSAAWGLPPNIAAKLFKAAIPVASNLKASAPRAPDSSLRFDIREGKAGITGIFVMSPTSLNAPAVTEDRNETIDFDDDDLDGEDDIED